MTRRQSGGFAFAMLCLMCLMVFAAGCSADDSDAGAAAEGGEKPTAEARKPAPAFELKDLEGRTVALADYRGRTVVVDFWATWCPPCIFQVPELNQLWAAHRDRGDLAVIGVAVDVEGAEVVAPWTEKEGVEYQIVLGDEDLARDFGAQGFPTLAIIDPNGNIESLHVGLIELEELEKLVKHAAEST